MLGALGGVKSANLWYLFAMIVELSSVTCYNIANNHVYDVVISYRSQLDDYGKYVVTGNMLI